jgi:predicted transcriptional regulator
MINSRTRRILDIVAELSHNDIKKDVLETEIISHSGISADEVRNCLYELEWQNLVKEGLPRPSHEEFKLWTITEEGLLQNRDGHQD